MPASKEKTGECRQCRSFCDKLIEPRGCVEMGCHYLYSYNDMLTGVQYVGCMQEVFGGRGRTRRGAAARAASAASR